MEGRLLMSYTHQDVFILSDQVLKERGNDALQFVDNHVNQLRLDGDQQGAVLWSMVLANLYHRKKTLPSKSN